MNELLNAINKHEFTIQIYENNIKKYGLKYTWDIIISFLDTNGIDIFNEKIVDFYDIGRLYEIGLAIENKYDKKECGKYFTPQDVSVVMSKLLIESEEISNLCDVACGCGNLSIEVLKLLKKRSVLEFNKAINNLHLYDNDSLALKICLSRICALFSVKKELINIHNGDFLSKTIKLPKDSFVISNPPYAQIKNIPSNWDYKSCINESKDLYVGFIEKIINNSKKSVIITPQSYIVGKNFILIRKELFKKGYGEIYSFDNVPGTIFNGKKEGIFNTNNANGVRACILNFNSSTTNKGYRLTHLIRFKTEERSSVINLDFLKSQLGQSAQNLTTPLKCYKSLEKFINKILNTSHNNISDLTTNAITDYPIYVNSSARYFIIGSKKQLNRNGFFTLFAKDESSFYLLYALLNSSYCYMWWRMLDGGILLPKNLLLKIPFPNDIKINNTTKEFIKHMIINEGNYLVYKKNAGKYQESIKFPQGYRLKLNNLLFGDIDLSIVHLNNIGV